MSTTNQIVAMVFPLVAVAAAGATVLIVKKVWIRPKTDPLQTEIEAATLENSRLAERQARLVAAGAGESLLDVSKRHAALHELVVQEAEAMANRITAAAERLKENIR
jgi:hypothetical protein